MTTTGRPLPRADKRVLLVRCAHTNRCECHRLALAELRACSAREWAASAHVYPHITLPPVELPPDHGLRVGNAEGRRDVLGAACAWACLALAAAILAVLIVRSVWLWWLS